MFRRALAMFCLPCGGEADRDDVSEFDPDTEYFIPQNFQALKARLRAERYEKYMAQMEAYFEIKMKATPSADVRGTERGSHQASQQQGDSLRELQMERASLQDSHVEGRSVGKEAGVQSAQTAPPAAAAPGGCTGGEASPPTRRPRGCRRCWARRLAGRVTAGQLQHRQGYRLRHAP